MATEAVGKLPAVIGHKLGMFGVFSVNKVGIVAISLMKKLEEKIHQNCQNPLVQKSYR